MGAADTTIPNILSFDVEDWPQSTFDFDLPITPRVVDNTARILDLCAAAEVQGTFFVLGLVAETHPALVRRIRDAGHEVASHGHDHRPVFAMSPATFRADLQRTRAAIESACGVRVAGYRAPDFSIPAAAFWALEILAEEGYRYDSSLFPWKGPRYGVAEAFDAPFRVRTRAGDLVEFPLVVSTRLGRRLPAVGGGYFRLFPYAWHRDAVRRLNRRRHPATAYFHPYEIDPDEIRRSPHRLPLTLRWSQGIGRSRVAAKMSRLLRDARWGTAAAWLGNDAACGDRTLDLTGAPGGAPRFSGSER
ncbi:MAG TPA: polysaccharide deacetylase family protein [Candidatus Polarisedimenticolia bacterium]|nr:polysaccharide deacetylase family protein [Candidatus Polarisedimenticolia bacterium]